MLQGLPASTAESIIAAVNRENSKAFSRVLGLIHEGRKKGHALPAPPRPPSASLAAQASKQPVVSGPAAARGKAKGGATSGQAERPRSASRGGGAAPEHSEVKQRWAQVEWLLRKPIVSQADLERASKDSARGERYLANIRTMAKRSGMRRGALSRAALPFDDHTSLADQSNMSNRKSIRSIEAKDLLSKGLVTEGELDDLTSDGVALRALLRVKIADDADLDQAEEAVSELTGFLSALHRAASRTNRGAFALFEDVSR